MEVSYLYYEPRLRRVALSRWLLVTSYDCLDRLSCSYVMNRHLIPPFLQCDIHL